MIGYLHGTIVALRANRAVLSNGHIGYEVILSPTTLTAHPLHIGDVLSVHCHTVVREEDISVYGFSTPEDVDWFRFLLSVNGVGPSAALSILGALGVSGIAQALTVRNAAAFRGVKGIGLKLAERILLDLADKPHPTASEQDSLADKDFIVRCDMVRATLSSLKLSLDDSELKDIVRKTLSETPDVSVKSAVTASMKAVKPSW